MILAELDNNNVVVGLKMVKEMINDGKHIEITTFDKDLLYRKYENGQWSEEKYLPPEPQLQPTVEEQILFETQYQTAVLEILSLGGM